MPSCWPLTLRSQIQLTSMGWFRFLNVFQQQLKCDWGEKQSPKCPHLPKLWAIRKQNKPSLMCLEYFQKYTYAEFYFRLMCLRYFQEYIYAEFYFFLLGYTVGPFMYIFWPHNGPFQTCLKIIHFELLGVSKYEEISPKMGKQIFPNRNFQLWEDARADICPSFCGFYSSSFYSPHLSTSRHSSKK